MKPIHILFACFFFPVVALGQTSNPNPDSSANDTSLAAEVKALRDALLQTQKQMAAQEREIKTLKAQSKDAVTISAPSELPSHGNGAAGPSAVPTPAIEPTSVSAGANIKPQPAAQQLQEQGKSAP